MNLHLSDGPPEGVKVNDEVVYSRPLVPLGDGPTTSPERTGRVMAVRRDRWDDYAVDVQDNFTRITHIVPACLVRPLVPDTLPEPLDLTTATDAVYAEIIRLHNEGMTDLVCSRGAARRIAQAVREAQA